MPPRHRDCQLKHPAALILGRRRVGRHCLRRYSLALHALRCQSRRSKVPGQCSKAARPAHLSAQPGNWGGSCWMFSQVTSAAVNLGFDCFEPFDLNHNQEHDMLDNTVFEALSNCVGQG